MYTVIDIRSLQRGGFNYTEFVMLDFYACSNRILIGKVHYNIHMYARVVALNIMRTQERGMTPCILQYYMYLSSSIPQCGN